MIQGAHRQSIAVLQQLPFISSLYSATTSASIAGKLFGFVLGVGIVEEATKALPIWWLYLHKRNPDSLNTIVFLGCVSGFAFGIAEATKYSMARAAGSRGLFRLIRQLCERGSQLARRVDFETHHHHELALELAGFLYHQLQFDGRAELGDVQRSSVDGIEFQNAAGVQIRNRLAQLAWERHGVAANETRRRYVLPSEFGAHRSSVDGMAPVTVRPQTCHS